MYTNARILEQLEANGIKRRGGCRVNIVLVAKPQLQVDTVGAEGTVTKM